MRRAALKGIDHANLAAAVGPGSYARGVAYFETGAVQRVGWDGTQSALVGTVRNPVGDVYSTTAYFTLAEDLPPQFEDGRCSCPVGVNCKHVVALVLAGSQAPAAAIVPVPRDPADAPGAWRRSLESLLVPRAEVAIRAAAEVPLAIELALVPAVRPGRPSSAQEGQPLRLTARLLRPGKNGNWINGQLSWNQLDSLAYQPGYLPGQVRLLQELYAVYHLRGSHRAAWGYSGYGDEKTIEVSAFESDQLWRLLDRAAAAGVQLRYGQKLGTIDGYASAELLLDVTDGVPAGTVLVTPVLRIEGATGPARPVAFIGREAHGVVYLDAGPEQSGTSGEHYSMWPFRLARLARPVPAALQQLAARGQWLEIPAAERDSFRDEYSPRLRHLATVISSDGSFTAPEVSDPELVLTAAYLGGHDLDVTWEWEYRVGGKALRAALRSRADEDGNGADGYRDIGAEQEILASLDLPLDEFGLLERFAYSVAQPGALAPVTRFGGTRTMLFSTELLPLAAAHPNIRVEVTGDPPDYRAADDRMHITLSTADLDGDTDWFDLGVTVTVDGHKIAFGDLFLALSRGDQYLLLEDGAYITLDKPELRVLQQLIEEARQLLDMPRGSLRISPFQAGLWDELMAIGIVDQQSEAWQRRMQGLLHLDTVAPASLPPGLVADLRPYQLDGFRWLAFLWQQQLGGILADDMGLGKTLQSLALILHARQVSPAAPPFLIVAPTSVVSNWAAESAKFTPGLRVACITETTARRKRDLAQEIAGADLVVTSYALLRIDIDHFLAHEWSGLILDEAQFAKNHQSKAYQCARRVLAPFKLAITGTPMENNLMELWSLLSITAPGLFPSPGSFRDYYARPIERGDHPELLAQFRRRIKPLVKRRTKEMVAADLPPKQEQVVQVELHPRHRRIYETHLQRERQKVLGLIHDLNAHRFTILRSLTMLRQLSLHAGLVDEAAADIPCAKIGALLADVQDVVDGGHRALVFSQFTGFLRLVADNLSGAGISYCYLDGKTRDRAAVVDSFRNGAAPVFLISLKAGGFGLNLTEADYCFLLDPWWNPATENQAIDRTHRIGQTRNVMVYRLISAGTIEEKVMALKERKAELFTSVLDSGDTFGTGLTEDDIRGLFS